MGASEKETPQRPADRWWPNLMHCGSPRQDHRPHYWADPDFKMTAGDEGQWLCPGGRGVKGERPKQIENLEAEIARLKVETVILSDNPDDMIDCYDDPDFVEPPEESREGRL